MVLLFLGAVREVAGVTESWDDIRVTGKLFVNCSYPEGHLVCREMLLEILHSICACDRTYKMCVGRLTLFA